jgi:hypothetical protein
LPLPLFTGLRNVAKLVCELWMVREEDFNAGWNSREFPVRRKVFPVIAKQFPVK